jgi:hypothetical protein
MTFAELLQALEARSALSASRVKDIKTSMRYLASALGYGSLEQCPVGDACQDPATWTAALETYFATLTAQGRTMSASTRRNTRNNLRVVFRLAEEEGLLAHPLPSRLLTKPNRTQFEQEQLKTAPYHATYHPPSGPRRFGLLQAQWPEDIVQGWREYRARVGLRLRETTLRANASRLVSYLGYLAHICGRTPTWEDCFDVAQLTEFVRWHGTRMGCPVSIQGQLVARQIAAMALVLNHPASQALADFRRTLPEASPMHQKRAHWVSLATLEAVAEAWLEEGRAPYTPFGHLRNPGVWRAVRFQRGVILKLLIRIPLRQRNVREMRLDRNLYQDQTEHWQVHFRGDELKIGRRGTQVNEYKVDLTEHFADFLPVLDEFLRVHRPRLPNAATSPFCFLTYQGRPYTIHSLYKELSTAVAMRTGQRFYPHLIRTIWATEYLEKTQDYAGAAVMLGDTLPVVMKTYYDIIHKDYHARAAAFLSTVLHSG